MALIKTGRSHFNTQKATIETWIRDKKTIPKSNRNWPENLQLKTYLLCAQWLKTHVTSTLNLAKSDACIRQTRSSDESKRLNSYLPVVLVKLSPLFARQLLATKAAWLLDV